MTTLSILPINWCRASSMLHSLNSTKAGRNWRGLLSRRRTTYVQLSRSVMRYDAEDQARIVDDPFDSPAREISQGRLRRDRKRYMRFA
jgi:hypothetical protein